MKQFARYEIWYSVGISPIGYQNFVHSIGNWVSLQHENNCSIISRHVLDYNTYVVNIFFMKSSGVM